MAAGGPAWASDRNAALTNVKQVNVAKGHRPHLPAAAAVWESPPGSHRAGVSVRPPLAGLRPGAEEVVDRGRDVCGLPFWYHGPWLIALCVAVSIAWFNGA